MKAKWFYKIRRPNKPEIEMAFDSPKDLDAFKGQEMECELIKIQYEVGT